MPTAASLLRVVLLASARWLTADVTRAAHPLSSDVPQPAQQRVPNQDNMFSDVGHYPRHDMRVQADNAVPAHAGQQGGADTFAAGPLEMAVTGTHRYKYFKRPIVPFMQSVPPEVCVPRTHTPCQPAGAVRLRVLHTCSGLCALC